VVGCWRGYLSGAICRLAYGQVVPDTGPLNGCVCVQNRDEAVRDVVFPGGAFVRVGERANVGLHRGRGFDVVGA